MFCGKCGTKLPDTAKFCAKCGAKIGNSGSKAVPEASVQMPGANKIDELIKRADKLTDDSKWDEVVSVCTEAIKLDGGRAEAYCFRGTAYLNLQKQSLALRDLSRAIELKPDYADAFLVRGMIYQKIEGDIEKALMDYDEAIQFKDNLDVDALSSVFAWRGLIYYGKEEYDKAMEDCDKAINIDPKSSEAYNTRGLVFSAIEENKKALSDYNKAIKLDAEYAVPVFNRGQLYFDQGEFEKALADFEKASEIDPDDEDYKKAIENTTTVLNVVIKCDDCGELFSVKADTLTGEAPSCKCPKCQSEIKIQFTGFCDVCEKVVFFKTQKGKTKGLLGDFLSGAALGVGIVTLNPKMIIGSATSIIKSFSGNDKINALGVNCSVCGQLHLICTECGTFTKYPQPKLDGSIKVNCENCGTLLYAE